MPRGIPKKRESVFTIVTQENFHRLKRRIAVEKGAIFIAEPGHNSYPGFISDIRIGLWDKPILDEGFSFHVKRGSKRIHGEPWQTGWENDREYSLWPRPKPTESVEYNYCRSLSESLVLKPYEFKIGFQATVCRDLFADDNLVLYLPDRSIRLRVKALEYALRQMIRRMNKSLEAKGKKELLFPESNIQKIIAYMTPDFTTSMILKKNIEAGLTADSLLDTLRS